MIHLRIDTIKETWISENIKLSPPTTPKSIIAAEEILGFQFPDDYKEFYLQLDGFADWGWTKNMFSIWPLARTVKEYHHEHDKSFIVFADYLINSHQLGFLKSKNGIFKKTGETPILIADSFSEAIALIHLDADILY